MSVQVTLTFTTIAEAAAFLAGGRPATAEPLPTIVPPQVPPAPEPAEGSEGKGRGGRRKKGDAAEPPAVTQPTAEEGAASTTQAEEGNAGAATAAAASTVEGSDAGATTSPTSSTEPVVEAKPFEYATLQAAVYELAAIDKQAVMALAAQFGQKTFKTLEAARWPEAHAAVKAKIEELKAQDELA